jgi:membrane-associated phospholipid phosphatase
MTPSHTPTSTHHAGVVRLARVITEVLAPWAVIVLLSTAVALRADNFRPWPALMWALVVATFSAGVPMHFITRGARVGKYDTHHVNNREGRSLVLVVCFGSTAVGLSILLLGSAPHATIVMTIVMLAVLLVTGLITVVARWKISMHAAVSAGGVAMLLVLYGPWSWLLFVIVAMVCWSRVILGDHTPGQVSIGAVTGFLISGALFVWLL